MAPFLFTRNILRKQPITQFGDGSTVRDYTYIDDIVAGVVAALDRACPYEIFNLGNCRPIRLDDFIQSIAAAVGVTPIIEYMSMQPGDVLKTCADTTKAHVLLGYTPRTPFEEGIGRFVAWYRAHEHLYA
jgi:UDP-glucuronate 4-epimerase